MRGRTIDQRDVFDESLLYDDFDVERFLKSVEKLDSITETSSRLWARPVSPPHGHRFARRRARIDDS